MQQTLSETTVKKIYRSGFLLYAVLFFLSIWFYKERTIFADIAYLLFDILKDGGPSIQVYRFGAIFTQIFPVIGGKLGLELRSVMILYSAGVICYYTVCYWLCGTVFKQYHMALGLLLLNILFVTDTFFWMQAELPQGLAFMFVTFSLIDSSFMDRNKLLSVPVLLLCVITCAFFHPLVVIPFMYIVGYHYISKGVFANNKIATLLLAAGFFIILMVIKAYFFTNAYDDKMGDTALAEVQRQFPNYFTNNSNTRFVRKCFTTFYWIPLIFVAANLLFFMRREWLKMVFVSASVAGYILMINITYPYHNVTNFYLENMYLPVAVMLAIPLLFDLLPALEQVNKTIIAVFFILIFATGIYRIISKGELYEQRLHWLRSFLTEHEEEKLMISLDVMPADTLLVEWGTPYEFWLLSTVEHNSTASIIIHDHVENVEWAWGERKAFVSRWGVYPYEQLPERYFRFADTTSHYRIVKKKSDL